jgi:hypothetical protein
MHGYDPQFDGPFIYQRDMDANPGLRAEKPNPLVYERTLSKESKSQ